MVEWLIALVLKTSIVQKKKKKKLSRISIPLSPFIRWFRQMDDSKFEEKK